MHHVATQYGPRLCRTDCGEGDGLSRQRDEFDLVRFAALMNVHDSSHVSGLHAVCLQVFRQDYAIMLVHLLDDLCLVNSQRMNNWQLHPGTYPTQLHPNRCHDVLASYI